MRGGATVPPAAFARDGDGTGQLKSRPFRPCPSTP